jgi:tetratricopeptide (TPR) repeat protein
MQSARAVFSLIVAASGLILAAPSACPAAQEKQAGQAQQPLSPAQARKKIIDALFARLKKAPDAASAGQIRALIAAAWAHPESPTADLLMARAESALKTAQQTQASGLLDRLVSLYPEWGYAWRRRAQSALAQGDAEGAMLDLSRALNAEPRDFVAMAELAELMRAAHQDKPALEMMRRALDLDPANGELRDATERLGREVEGRDI